MHGFCFSEYGEELEICYPQSSPDFFVLLMDHMKRLDINKVAVSLDTYKFNIWGIKDLLRAGYKVIVVDPVYSPINDEEVLPVHVHRNKETLAKHHDDCIVIGDDLIPYYHSRRGLLSLKTYFQDDGGAYKMDVFASGWTIRNTTGSATRINSRLYEYVIERDYELENKNAKRSKRK